jgi:hypothetical protein
MTFTLTTPKSLLKGFLLFSDRLYFSTPIEVEPIMSELTIVKIHGKARYAPLHTMVHDPERGHTYPTNPKWVREDRG